MNELTVVSNEIMNAKENLSVWASFTPETASEKMALYNALSAKSTNISELMGRTFCIQNVVFQGREFTNEETKELEKNLKVIIITDNGIYHSYSRGIINSVQSILEMFGLPGQWEQPLEFTVERVALKNGGQTFILRGV